VGWIVKKEGAAGFGVLLPRRNCLSEAFLFCRHEKPVDLDLFLVENGDGDITGRLTYTV